MKNKANFTNNSYLEESGSWFYLYDSKNRSHARKPVSQAGNPTPTKLIERPDEGWGKQNRIWVNLDQGQIELIPSYHLTEFKAH